MHIPEVHVSNFFVSKDHSTAMSIIIGLLLVLFSSVHKNKHLLMCYDRLWRQTCLLAIGKFLLPNNASTRIAIHLVISYSTRSYIQTSKPTYLVFHPSWFILKTQK